MPTFAPVIRESKPNPRDDGIIMNKVKTCVLSALSLCAFQPINAQTESERISTLEEKLQTMTDLQRSVPQIHGILRGKYEYEPDLSASRFEVRNARLSADGSLSLRSSYKLEVDLCDESAIKMKDAWVRIEVPLHSNYSQTSGVHNSSDGRSGQGGGSSLRITLGQQRMPFSIDAHRNPSAQYFANRSFIAKQVGDMRDVGAAAGYDIINKENRKILSVDAGIYNGSNLDNQKTAWFTSPAYSARIQYLPVKGMALIPSVQHQLIADRKASYTSVDFGAYYEFSGFHLEAEYLHKFYAKEAFDDCNAIDAMAIYKMPVRKSPSAGLRTGYLSGVSYLLRYDYMDNHSDGKRGFADGTTRLLQSDAQRHRLTAGLTLHVANKYFPTDIRLNYEKYWYPHTSTTLSTGYGTPKESEQDKLVAELMIRF